MRWSSCLRLERAGWWHKLRPGAQCETGGALKLELLRWSNSSMYPVLEIVMSRLIAGALCVAAAGLVVSWLVLAGNSPLSDWSAGSPWATNIASAVNLPTVLFALTGVPGVRPPPDGAIACVAVLQWLVYGSAIACVWRLIRRASRSPQALGRA